MQSDVTCWHSQHPEIFETSLLAYFIHMMDGMLCRRCGAGLQAWGISSVRIIWNVIQSPVTPLSPHFTPKGMCTFE